MEVVPEYGVIGIPETIQMYDNPGYYSRGSVIYVTDK
jgi:hypothetical protein